MEGLRRWRRDATTHGAGSDTPREGAPAAGVPVSRERGVQVVYGASVQTLALGGLTVSQARSIVETILGVNPASPVLVNGRSVRASYLITDGDALEFVHHAGEKGAQWTCV